MNTNDKLFFAFDWNGTLLNDLRGIATAFGEVLKSCGRKACSIAEFQDWFEFPIDRWYLNAGLPQEIVETRLHEIHPIMAQSYEGFEDVASLRDGAKEALSAIAGENATCAIFSNHYKGRIVAQCVRHGIEGYFDDVLASRDVEEQLQAPSKKERLRRYMAERGLNPAQTFIIGDTPEEIRVAREFGAISVALTGGYAAENRLLACDPDYLIHSLSELPPIVQSLFPLRRRA